MSTNKIPDHLVPAARAIRRVAAPFRHRWPMVPRHIAITMRAEGMTSVAEAKLLYRLASEVRQGCIVEVGAYRGRSSIALALGAANSSAHPVVFSLDPHVEFHGAMGGHFGPWDRTAYLRNLIRAGVTETVRPISLSAEVVREGWNEPIGLLWLDGDHTYEGVKRDLEAFEPWLVAGAIVAFDDSTTPQSGPDKLLAELDGELWQRKEIVGKVTVMKRTGRR